MTKRRSIFVFLDGVGIGDEDPGRNPIVSASLPFLEGLLGGIPTLDRPGLESSWATSYPLDATLGVEGLPQSGTGETALLTGVNAARLFGRHFGPWTPVMLRPLLVEHNLLAEAIRSGLRAQFANAYPRGFLSTRRGRRPAAPPLAAAAAGLLTRHEESLRDGRAVASEIVNTGWREHLGHTDVPDITPEAAGENLGRLAAEAELTLYAHYSTDNAGHRAGMAGCMEALELVDRFLAGIWESMPREAVLVVASDHGNIEDVEEGHTRNPALGLIASHSAPFRPQLTAITDVAPALLAWLQA